MAETNDYVVPHLDGLPYLDKPIVYFAAEAPAMEVLGPTELAARLPAYLFTLATAAMVFWFGRKLWGIDEACVAAIAFLSMPLTIAFARTVIFDSALTFFIVVAIVAFYFAVETEERRWVRTGVDGDRTGRSDKGAGGDRAAAARRASVRDLAETCLERLWSIAGLILFVVVIAPWVVAMSKSHPGFSALRARDRDRAAVDDRRAETHRTAVVLHPVSDRRRIAVGDRRDRELAPNARQARRCSISGSGSWFRSSSSRSRSRSGRSTSCR